MEKRIVNNVNMQRDEADPIELGVASIATKGPGPTYEQETSASEGVTGWNGISEE